ncbi:MAG: DUF1080 domain-containing protein [Acidobacteriaceae bacterium]|jgi:hypothetical protein|nr:DUF1080 domain-containing protein [Acidobacteriaceae bacterium]
MRWLFLFLFILNLPAQVLQMGEASQGFVPLFNGRDFGRWEGDEQIWQIERDRMWASTDKMTGRKRSLALVHRGERYQDFELRMEVRLRNGRLKLWVQSEERTEGVMEGPSVEISEARKYLRANEWVEYKLLCQDGKMTVWVNGEKREEDLPATKQAGLLAFEVEAVPAMEVRLRTMRIRKIN